MTNSELARKIRNDLRHVAAQLEILLHSLGDPVPEQTPECTKCIHVSKSMWAACRKCCALDPEGRGPNYFSSRDGT